LEEERREKSVLQFGQEYGGLFLEDLRQYFDDSLIEKCCILKRPQPPKPINNLFVGIDIARLGGDECSYEILYKLKDNRFHHVENITKTKQLTTKTEQDIIDLDFLWNLSKIGIDAGSGSLGVGIYDRLMLNQKIKRKLVAMNNRSISLDRDGKSKQRIFKEDMYDNMKNMLEKGELYLLDDDDVRLSMKSIQWEIIEKNGLHKVHIFSDYGHIVEGLVRASYLAKKEKLNKVWISYV